MPVSACRIVPVTVNVNRLLALRRTSRPTPLRKRRGEPESHSVPSGSPSPNSERGTGGEVNSTARRFIAFGFALVVLALVGCQSNNPPGPTAIPTASRTFTPSPSPSGPTPSAAPSPTLRPIVEATLPAVTAARANTEVAEMLADGWTLIEEFTGPLGTYGPEGFPMFYLFCK